MPEDIYIINYGNAVITPSQHPDLATLTLKLGHHYHKLRDIRVAHASHASFNPKEWFSMGKGDTQILLKKDQVENAFAALKGFPRHQKVLHAFSNCLGPKTHIESIMTPSAEQSIPNSRLFSGFLERDTLLYPPTQREKKQLLEYIKKYAYKMTCIMNPESELQVVAVKKIGEGEYKYVKKKRSIWENARSVSEFGPIVTLAKGQKNVDPKDLLKEVGISQRLNSAKVPFIRRIRKIARNDPNKAGLMMEYCEGKTLWEYIRRSHFDPVTHKVKPPFRQEHISLVKQVAEALYGMKKQNLVHCDVKLKNILLKDSLIGHESCVSDFGGVEQNGKRVQSIQTTFPPPEVVESIEYQRKRAVDRFTLAQKAKFCLFISSLQKQGLPLDKIEKEKNKYLKEFVKDIYVDGQIDAWGFGILLFETMHNYPEIANKLSHEHPGWEIKQCRDIIVNKLLDPKDPVDQITMKLLSTNPKDRFTIQDARDYLQEAT